MKKESDTHVRMKDLPPNMPMSAIIQPNTFKLLTVKGTKYAMYTACWSFTPDRPFTIVFPYNPLKRVIDSIPAKDRITNLNNPIQMTFSRNKKFQITITKWKIIKTNTTS